MLGFAIGFVIVVTLVSVVARQSTEINELKEFIDENW